MVNNEVKELEASGIIKVYFSYDELSEKYYGVISKYDLLKAHIVPKKSVIRDIYAGISFLESPNYYNYLLNRGMLAYDSSVNALLVLEMDLNELALPDDKEAIVALPMFINAKYSIKQK